MRGVLSEFVSSKLLKSWVALERAGRIARQRGLPGGNGRWEQERDAIYEEIMEMGWNEERNSFVQFYGSDALDASLLLMPLVKFVGPTDPRWIATLDRIQQELTYDTLVERYQTENAAPDGLDGGRRQLQPVLLLARRMPDAGRAHRGGAPRPGEDVFLRQPPRVVLRGDRLLRRGPGQPPTGVHAPGSH